MGFKQKVKGALSSTKRKVNQKLEAYDQRKRDEKIERQKEKAEAAESYRAGRLAGARKGGMKRGYDEAVREYGHAPTRFGALGSAGKFVAAHPLDLDRTSKLMNGDITGGSGGVNPSLSRELSFGSAPRRSKKGKRRHDDFEGLTF